MIVLGVDPGLTGALAWVLARKGRKPTLIAVADMPTQQTHKGRTVRRHIAAREVARLIGPPFSPPDLALIELVGARPGQGLSSTFRFGYSTGLVAGVLAAHTPALEEVAPQVWRRGVGLRGDKAEARALAASYFPNQAGQFARAKDHNRAEAALIAFFGAMRFSD